MTQFWKTLAIGIAAAALALLPAHAENLATQVKVPNFALLDHEGKFHELDYYSRMEGVTGIALFVQGNGCPLVRKRVPELKRLRDAYQDRGILFGMINVNPQDERADIAAEVKEFDIDMPVLVDESQAVAASLAINRTAEMILISTASKGIVYRGAIDDRLSYQKDKPEATQHYLEDAMNALLKGESILTPYTDAPGCKVTLTAPKSEDISYSKEIVPILKSRCVTCHTQGGIGPFAMSSYKKVTGWSDMIEEVILTKQMPPWHADPHIGKFSNDSGLTPQEQTTLIAWIRGGSLRGEGEDGLEGYAPEMPEWKLGPPDHIIQIPEQKIPAEGILDYRYVEFEAPFDKDVWLRAAEVNPDNTRVLHHVIATYYPKEKNGSSDRQQSERWITGYAPGTQAEWLPPDTGIFLPKDHRIRLQLHYTVSGKEEVDRSQIGLYLAATPPSKPYKTSIVAHSHFRIPPHANEHPAEYTNKIKKDWLIYAMNPHMHFRGKRMSFEAHLPDGTTLPLLSVPHYNFNWQRTYTLKEPLKIPAGSRIVIKNAWDNSALNLHNPDPTKEVKWGEQSFDEMFFATISYVEAD